MEVRSCEIARTTFRISMLPILVITLHYLYELWIHDEVFEKPIHDGTIAADNRSEESAAVFQDSKGFLQC